MLRFSSFESLINIVKKSNTDNHSEDTILGDNQTILDKAGNAFRKVKAKLSLQEMKEPPFSLRGGARRTRTTENYLYLDENDTQEDAIPVMINWMVKISKSLVEKVNELSFLLKSFNEKLATVNETTDKNAKETDDLKKENTHLKEII